MHAYLEISTKIWEDSIRKRQHDEKCQKKQQQLRSFLFAICFNEIIWN